MYQLIQLSDLESDFINPHDAARNINWVVVSTVSRSTPEFAGGCCAWATLPCQAGAPRRLSVGSYRVHDPLRSQVSVPWPTCCWLPLPLRQIPEYACQALLTALLLLSGRWAYGALHLVLLGYHVQQVGPAACCRPACENEGWGAQAAPGTEHGRLCSGGAACRARPALGRRGRGTPSAASLFCVHITCRPFAPAFRACSTCGGSTWPM